MAPKVLAAGVTYSQCHWLPEANTILSANPAQMLKSHQQLTTVDATSGPNG